MTSQDAPLTPGSVWRSRGTSGHDRYQVRITKLSAAGRVAFVRVAHRQGHGERRSMIDEPAFRRNYEPVKVEPVTEAQVAAHQLDALRYRERGRRIVEARTNGALVDRLRLDPEDLTERVRPATETPDFASPPSPAAAGAPEPLRPDAAEGEAFSVGEPVAPAAVPVLDAYLDAGLAALTALEGQRRAKDEAIARLVAERDVLVAQRAAIAASLETLSQQAPVAPKEARR